MKKIFTSFILALACATSFAQSVTISTGPAKKGYSNLFKDINEVCGPSVAIQEKNSDGGLDNITILSERTATMGIVPLDVFLKMQKSDDSIGRFKAVAALNHNLFHILVRQSGVTIEGKRNMIGMKGTASQRLIETEKDLKGLNVGLIGSAQLTGRSYISGLVGGFNAIDYNGEQADGTAQADLKAGKIDAIITAAAWPAGPINKLESKSGLALVRWTAPATNGYKVIRKNYKKLNALGYTYLAAPNVLFARPIDPNSDAGQSVTKLQSCLRTNLNKFKTGEGFQPSWDEIDSIATSDELQAWNGIIRKK
jgi:TRAP-type uncharacterized transport system substrate-binding protein